MLKDIARGGQTFLHAYRMIKQIGRVLLFWFVFSFFISMGGWIYWQIKSYDYYVFGKFIEAKVLVKYSHIYANLGMKQLAYSSERMVYQNRDGDCFKIPASRFVKNLSTTHFLRHFKILILKGSIINFIISFLFVTVVGIFLSRRGKKINREKHLRGASMVEPDQLKRMLIESNSLCDLKLAGIPLPKGSDTQHILMSGSTGAGKSMCMTEILAQLRQLKRRVIVYDHVGVFVKRFYRPGVDTLLNAFDARSPTWSIWSECLTDSHYDAIAESLMPMPTRGQDPFWVMAARIMFAVAARRLKQQKEMSNSRLLSYLLMADLNRIQDLVANTEAETLASEKSEKMALSVKAVLSTYLRSLRYLPDGLNPFSIRQWIIREDNKEDWLFITTREDQHATLKPLISTYLDVASNAILSLSRDVNRRVYLAIDETDSLQYMPSLLQFVNKARQFGGCGIFSIQAISQLYKNFGEDDAETLISCCNTGVHFRSRGKKTSAYISELLGEREIEEANENISYGVDVRDGVSLSQQKSVKQLILSSQIKQLDDLEAYIQLKGNWPITKVKFQYQHYPEEQPDFVPREIQADPMLDDAIQKIQRTATKQEPSENVIKNQSAQKSKGVSVLEI